MDKTMIQTILEGNYPSDMAELAEVRSNLSEVIDLAKSAIALIDDELKVQILETGEKSTTLNDGTKFTVRIYKSRTEVDKEGVKDFVRLNAEANSINSGKEVSMQILEYFEEFFNFQPRWGALEKKLGLQSERFCTYEEREIIKVDHI